MRPAFVLFVFALAGVFAGCCKKDEPTKTTTTTATAVLTATARPCSGMNSAKDCEACCNPKFHPGWAFANGKCDCGK